MGGVLTVYLRDLPQDEIPEARKFLNELAGQIGYYSAGPKAGKGSLGPAIRGLYSGEVAMVPVSDELRPAIILLRRRAGDNQAMKELADILERALERQKKAL